VLLCVLAEVCTKEKRRKGVGLAVRLHKKNRSKLI
jgi:hypothetical protein